jgi:hypothetical protein
MLNTLWLPAELVQIAKVLKSYSYTILGVEIVYKVYCLSHIGDKMNEQKREIVMKKIKPKNGYFKDRDMCLCDLSVVPAFPRESLCNKIVTIIQDANNFIPFDHYEIDHPTTPEPSFGNYGQYEGSPAAYYFIGENNQPVERIIGNDDMWMDIEAGTSYAGTRNLKGIIHTNNELIYDRVYDELKKFKVEQILEQVMRYILPLKRKRLLK